MKFATSRALTVSVIAGIGASVLTAGISGVATAKNLKSCEFHMEQPGGILDKLMTPDFVAGADRRSIAWFHKVRGGPPLRPSDREKFKAPTCVVHVDCEIPKNVGKVIFQLEEYRGETDFLKGVLMSSWVEPGFNVRFRDASGTLIKDCKVTSITDQ